MIMTSTCTFCQHEEQARKTIDREERKKKHVKHKIHFSHLRRLLETYENEMILGRHKNMLHFY